MKKRNNTIIVMGVLFLAYPIFSFSQTVGSPAPDFTLNTNKNSSFTLSENLGKVVFIFFFGYACPHCLANGNNTETGIYEIFKDNADFIAIGIDTWDGNNAGVENFKSTTGISYPLCLTGSDIEELYQTTYDRIAVIDREGIIRYKSTANATANVVDAAAQVINSLLTTTSTTDVPDDNIGLTVYPVPATDRLFVRISAANNHGAVIKIINPIGQVVLRHVVPAASGSEEIISVSSLKPGLYFLQYKLNENSKTPDRNSAGIISFSKM